MTSLEHPYHAIAEGECEACGAKSLVCADCEFALCTEPDCNGKERTDHGRLADVLRSQVG